MYPAPRVAVINAHDPHAEELAAAARRQARRFAPMALARANGARQATRSRPAGAVIELETPAGCGARHSRLAGEVNILNLLAALTAAHARGVSFADLVEFVPRLKPVPGRFQPVDAGQPFTVIVDYAHTDDALRNLTALARQMTAQSGGRVITLFGCGGDRDRTKRPKMGQAAGEGSDFVVATSDNPRSEDPRAILAEMDPALKATRRPIHHRTRPRRGDSPRALKRPRPATWFCIAGKGHEKEQILADRHGSFRRRGNCAFHLSRNLGYGGGQ